jgi:hypothetical protein
MTYILVDTANTFFRARHVINGDADIKLGMAFHITLNSIKCGDDRIFEFIFNENIMKLAYGLSTDLKDGNFHYIYCNENKLTIEFKEKLSDKYGFILDIFKQL